MDSADSSGATPRAQLAQMLEVTAFLLTVAFAGFAVHAVYVDVTGGASLEPLVRAVLTSLAGIGVWRLKEYIEPWPEADPNGA